MNSGRQELATRAAQEEYLALSRGGRFRTKLDDKAVRPQKENMSELPPLPRDQRKIDTDHLSLLSIFHFVGAGMALLGILFLHYAMFHAILDNPKMWENPKGVPPPAELFAVFKWFYLIIGAWFVASGVLNVVSGVCLRVRKRRTFSMIVAGLNCVHVPLGTVLGVLTLVVLMRDSVRESYEASS
jgi:hypothetical protein